MRRHSIVPVAPSSLALALAATAALTSCGEEAPPPPADLPPLVGLMEEAVTLWSRDTAPSDPLRIEINQTEMHVDSRMMYTLDRGRPPEAEITPDGLPQLRTTVQGARARSRAALIVNGTVPYGTTVRVMQTLLAAGYREISFAVHAPNSTAQGWMTLTAPRVVPAEGEVTFDGLTRPWSDFVSNWEAVYEACRSGHYVDCDGPPIAQQGEDGEVTSPVAEGGRFELRMFVRGQGMRFAFHQMGAPEPEAPRAAVAMIEGVPQAPRAEGEAPPPLTEGEFSFRQDEATRTEEPGSAISRGIHPVCGTQACPVVIEADAGTSTMRVLAFIGAAFPDGTTRPSIAFRLPNDG